LPHDSADGSDLYVRSLSFNSNDLLFATGSEDNLIRIWDISTLPKDGRKEQEIPADSSSCLIKTLQGHTQDVYALEFATENRIVSGSGDQFLRLWDVESGKCVCSVNSIDNAGDPEIPVNDSGITSLAISKDRKQIVTGSLDRLVRVYDLSVADASIKLSETFVGHDDSVYSVNFDNFDSSVISGSLDKTIRKWKLNADSPENCLQVISNHHDFVLSVVSSNSSTSSAAGKDRAFIISGSKDRSVQFWDETSQSHQLTLQGHKNSVISLAISPLPGVFATGSGDGRARIWSFTSKAE
jgi:glucose repression regulatory protein TUP1